MIIFVYTMQTFLGMFLTEGDTVSMWSMVQAMMCWSRGLAEFLRRPQQSRVMWVVLDNTNIIILIHWLNFTDYSVYICIYLSKLHIHIYIYNTFILLIHQGYDKYNVKYLVEEQWRIDLIDLKKYWFFRILFVKCHSADMLWDLGLSIPSQMLADLCCTCLEGFQPLRCLQYGPH